MPGRLFKINVATGVIDPTFTASTISGDIRDLDLVGNHLFVGGKFTHIGGIPQEGLGTVFADTGKRDPYFNSVLAGLHHPELAGAVTDVLQLSVNKQNTQLMAVGNFTTVDGQARSQIAKFNIGNAPTSRPERPPDPVDRGRPTSTRRLLRQLRHLHERRRVLAGRSLLRRLHHRCLRRLQQHQRHHRL